MDRKQITGFSILLGVAVMLTMWSPQSVRADDIEQAVATLQATDAAAQGAVEAAAAIGTLRSHHARALLPVLKGFRGASPLAANWLRNAFESIADDEIQAGRKLPTQLLLQFVQDTDESPIARRLAYEWLLLEDPSLAETLIPSMLLDPSSEFRRDAVARLIDQAAGAATADEGLKLYRQALSGAVHEDQVKTIAAALRKAEQNVDIQRHFGFLTSWKIVGPFNNREEQGYAVAYPPEEAIQLDAEYDSQYGEPATVKWAPISTDDDFGIVDIGKQISNYKGSLMYATTTFAGSRAQDVEIRLGTANAWKLWVNGKLVFAREEYHRSTRMDQYRIPVSLQAGENTLLIKVCQNEQDEDWAQDYHFQLRICDSTGAAVQPSIQAARNQNSPKGSN